MTTVDSVPPKSTDTSAYLTVGQQPAASYMTQNVAFVSDFINRLNYQRTPDNQPMDSTNRLIYGRERYLYDLFDQSDTRLNPRSPAYSPAYKAHVDDFVADVLRDTAKVFLPDAHEHLFAEVDYALLHGGKVHSAKVYLKMFRRNNAYDWKILDSENSLPLRPEAPPASTRPDSSATIFITSQTHETRFQNLYGHLKKRRNLLLLMPASQPITPALYALSQAIRDSTATVQGTRTVHLYLNTHQNWVLRLDDFVRNRDNSGWLIADLYGGALPTRLPEPIDRYLKQTN